ncbi:MAG: P-loop NTPase [Gemmatimonadaceae bacterium]|nr:P-loop NTPase [Gemmatimonadaceae bacterium]
MQRRALIADSAAGSPEMVAGVLTRFGFVRTASATDRDDAIAQMRDGHFDLVVIPVSGITSSQLLALEKEIRRNPNTAVIATAPVSDPDIIVRSMRAGVHEFLVYPPKPEEMAGSVERLMRRGRTETERGELIAVYSGKGGLGSTSIAVNVAQAFGAQRTDSRVALLDLVVAGGDVRVFLNLKPSYDLSHLVAKGNQVDAELLNSLLTPCPGGVWALPTGDHPEDEELFDTAAVGSILNLLRAHFGVTVVDCDHHLSEATLAALDAADRIVLVTQLSVPALRSTQRSLAVCRRLGYDDAKLCIVVNRYQSGDVLPVSDAEDLLRCPIYWKLPNDYRLSAASLTRGVPVSIEDAASKLARSYSDLARKLTGSGSSKSGSSPVKDGSGGSRLRRLFGTDKGVSHVA